MSDVSPPRHEGPDDVVVDGGPAAVDDEGDVTVTVAGDDIDGADDGVDVGAGDGVEVHELDRPIERWSSLDLARGAAGVVVAASGVLLAALATDTLGGMQADIARAVGRLPAPARSAAIGLAQLAAVAAPVVVTLAALVRRRLRMLAGLTLAAALATTVTSVISHAFIDEAQPAAWQALVERESWIIGRAFPTSAYLAGALATVVVTVRWLGPRWARPLWTTLAGFVLVRIVSGANLPLDLVVAAGVGLAAGSVALLVVGSPDLSPDGRAVAAALRRHGLRVTSLTEKEAPPGVTHAYLARTTDGPAVAGAAGEDSPGVAEPAVIEVDLHSESDRDRDVVARLYQRIRTRTRTRTGTFASVERVAERAAFVALWLDQLGLRVGRPRAVAQVGEGAALVAHDPVPGRTLSERGTDVSDDALASAWGALAALHDGRVAHGALDTDAVLVDDDGNAWLERLHAAELDAPEGLLLVDRANLLVSTTLAVGAERAVAACRRGLGADGLVATLPYVQIPALPLTTRLRLRRRENTVGAIRAQAEALTGAAEVELVRLARVQLSTLLMLGGGVLALVVLLPQLTNFTDSARAIGDADWPWLLPVLAVMPLWYAATTVTFRAATPLRPPFGLSYLNQLAAATLNRVTPNGIGGLGTNIRFLQRSGYDTTEAAAVMALVSLTGGVGGAILIAVFLAWAGQTQESFPWPDGAVLLVAAAAILGAIGLVVVIPALRRLVGDKIGPIVRQARSAITELLTDPRRCATMLGSSIGGSLLQLTCLWLVLEAFGASVGIAVMGAVLFGGKAVAGAAPTPGGLGAVEAALIGGLSGAGVDPAVATPAVLVFRLLTYWAVVVPGWFALRALRARHAL